MTPLPHRIVRRALPLLVVLAAACAGANTFTAREASTNQSLYEAALNAERAKNWEKASKGFEQLTFQLPARDPLLPLAYYHLGLTHEANREYILAAQAFARVPENFPEDTLAPEATFQSGMSYVKLWKAPDLDADYGTTAMTTFQSFLAAYPDSPRRADAQKEIDALNEKFAEKNLQTADLYAKQRAYDSSIIYYRDIVAHYGQTPAARKALLGLVKAFRAISYMDDAAEACATLRTKYPTDREVRSACGAAPHAPAPATP